jgi:hypothetical protein
MTYNCFHLTHEPKDVTDLRTIYFPYESIDQRSFNGLGNVSELQTFMSEK